MEQFFFNQCGGYLMAMFRRALATAAASSRRKQAEKWKQVWAEAGSSGQPARPGSTPSSCAVSRLVVTLMMGRARSSSTAPL